MGNVVISGNSAGNVTVVSNYFIDEFMTRANGEYVKIYLYLLRASNGAVNSLSISLSQIADVFDLTEKDVMRALKYWEEVGLMSLTFNENILVAIHFEEIKSDKYVSFAMSSDLIKPVSTAILEENETSTDTYVPVVNETTILETAAPVSKKELKKTISKERIVELSSNEEITELLYVIETYLGKTLSSQETNTILFFIDTLNFTTDLIEYLVEYCVSNNHKSMRYIESVAITWDEEGITTVDQAKNYTNSYNKRYYSVLNAFGITGRNVAKAEKQSIDKWIDEYGFSLDLVLEACNRTINAIHTPSFPYVDSILVGWKNSGVKTLADIEGNDKLYYNPKKKASALEVPIAKAKPTFSNYNQRTYDYNALEKNLLKRN